LETYAHVLDYEPNNDEANYQTAAIQLRLGKFQESLVHLLLLPAEVRGQAQTLSILRELRRKVKSPGRG
jgi:hypothetical protein